MSGHITWRGSWWSASRWRWLRGAWHDVRRRRRASAGSGRGRGRSTIEDARLFRRQRAVLERQTEPLPDVDERLGERVDQGVLVVGRRGDAQALGPLRHGRIIDRLNIDAVRGEQEVGRLLALLGLA